MALRTISLCAGIGGIDLGLRGIARTVCYVEREAFASALLVERMEEGRLDQAPIWSDLRTFDAKAWRGSVDLVTGGYPCQPFSHAGRRLGEADPRHLWPEVLRIYRDSGARYLFCENVAGHLSLGFSDVLADLAEMGANVEWGVFRASDVGAPHRRERLFFLADANCRGRTPIIDARGCTVEDGRGQVHAVAADGTLGDADDTRLEGRCVYGCGRPDQRTPWPPGPADADAWQRYLERGGPQPAVRGGPHGVPHRVDRLRALGNAVVPQVARLAWDTLSERLGR